MALGHGGAVPLRSVPSSGLRSLHPPSYLRGLRPDVLAPPMAPAPPPTDVDIQQAARHLVEGRTGDAVAVLEALAADFPAYVTAHVLLAKTYETQGRTAEALAAWHRAFFLMPGSALVTRHRARLLRQAAPAPAWVPVEAPEALADPARAAEQEPPASEESPSTPEAWEVPAPAEPPVALEEIDDLDTLIEQLESAPRIRPDPAFGGTAEGEEEDAEGPVSETLAQIFASQRHFGDAADAYDRLAAEHPERADEFARKAEEMRRRDAEAKP